MNRLTFRKVCVVAILFCQAGIAHADEGDSPTWLEHLGRDIAAPVLEPGRQYLLTGAALTLITYPLKKTNLQSEVAEDKPLGMWSEPAYKIGFWRTNVLYVGVAIGYGLIAGNSEAVTDGALMARASIYTALLVSGIEALHLEERPRKNGDMNAFPSGHASNAFAIAGVVARNHGWWFGVPAFAVASAVAFSRMNDNGHYLHDVVFGGAIGLSYAFGLDRDWGTKSKPLPVTFAPLFLSDSVGIGSVVRF